MGGNSKRSRIPTMKGAAFAEEQSNRRSKKKTSSKSQKGKSSRKRRAIEISSDSSDAEECCNPKRRRQPDPEEVDISEASEEEPEMVEEDQEEIEDGDSGGNSNGEDGAGEDEDVQPQDSEMNDGLKERHIASLPLHQQAKVDTTRDLRLVFGERVAVTFKKGNDRETVEGRWCNECRKNPKIKSLRKAFLTGSNTTCRGHIRQHYEFYSKRCKEDGIEENIRCVPPEILRARESKSNASIQSKLTSMVVAEKGPKQFTREGTLLFMTKFIACDDQAFEVANKPSFRNCLLSMRPQTVKADLPSDHDVRVCLQNQFVEYMNQLKSTIVSLPGKASITIDCWTADSTKASFVGITAHWIRVTKKGEWKLEGRVIALRGLSGDHGGKNLGRYVVGLCDRVGLIGKERSKLYGATLDNTSVNATICNTISIIHQHRNLEAWNYKGQQYMCLAHVVNLATVDVMAHITKIAVVETKSAIWDYDPADPANRISNGGLDVIATIRTLAIKIQASGSRIEKFNELQMQTGIPKPVKIPLHSNVRWGTAFGMLDRSLQLQNAITLFINCADDLFGPITTIRKDGRVQKTIPWTAFMLSADDWRRVADVRDILADSNKIQQCFSHEKKPTLWRALPLVKELQACWKKKQDGETGFERFTAYRAAIQDGLNKLKKYYDKFDEKPAYVLALLLHPYYKLDYIKVVWGGQDDEARRLFEQTAEMYWKNKLQRPLTDSPSQEASTSTSAQRQEPEIVSDFDRHRETLLKEGNTSETWGSEVRRYLQEVEREVDRKTDVVKWWQDHAHTYPTLARIALDVLPCQASSVPCERLFSAGKQVATERRSRLGSNVFEQLVVMKSAWQDTTIDWATVNSKTVEEVNLQDYSDLLQAEAEAKEWDKEDDGFLLAEALDSDEDFY